MDASVTAILEDLGLLLAIHFRKLSCKYRCICSPTCINYRLKHSVGFIGRVLPFLISSCLARMAVGTKSNGAGIGEFPSIVPGTAKLYHNCFNS